MLQVIALTMSTDKRSPLLAWGRQRSKLKDGWLKQLRNKHASSAIPRNLAQHLFNHAKNNPSAIAVISHQNKPNHWTFEDLKKDVIKCASFSLVKELKRVIVHS